MNILLGLILSALGWGMIIFVGFSPKVAQLIDPSCPMGIRIFFVFFGIMFWICGTATFFCKE